MRRDGTVYDGTGCDRRSDSNTVPNKPCLVGAQQSFQIETKYNFFCLSRNTPMKPSYMFDCTSENVKKW